MPETSVEQIYTVVRRIKYLRHSEGLSWREIAATGEFADLSHATLRDLANGMEPSREVCRRLGVRKTDRHRRHYEGGRGDKGRQRVSMVDEFLRRRGYGNLTEFIDKIIERDDRYDGTVDFHYIEND